MVTRIRTIHFDATAQLQEFVEKKVMKFEKLSDDVRSVEVTMTLIKPETVKNKEVSLMLTTQGGELFASKVSDRFEDALLDCIDALKVKLEKVKEKMR